MTCAVWLKDDPPKVSCVNTVASGIDHARRTHTNHDVRDVRAGEITYHFAHRFGCGRQYNITGLNEVGEEHPWPQRRFTYFVTPMIGGFARRTGAGFQMQPSVGIHAFDLNMQLAASTDSHSEQSLLSISPGAVCGPRDLDEPHET